MDISEIEEGKVYWLDDDLYAKYVFFLRRNIEELLMETFSLYGMGALVPGVTQVIVDLCEDFALQTRGVNKMINYKESQKKKGVMKVEW